MLQKQGHRSTPIPKSKSHKVPGIRGFVWHYGHFSAISMKIGRLYARKICAKFVKTRKQFVRSVLTLPWSCLRQKKGSERAVHNFRARKNFRPRSRKFSTKSARPDDAWPRRDPCRSLRPLRLVGVRSCAHFRTSFGPKKFENFRGRQNFGQPRDKS